ncbi:MAG: phytanoyl-CoA dioxygenase family protein [Hyphomonas sp.]|nr:phytanoyl-CoA dioxygenase family protein [Hyphomonas sp.]MCA8905638.1 phytanoyl-CoA dioxygenase family protein [Hyphomonas sp.]
MTMSVASASEDLRAQFARDGFLILRNVFSQSAARELADMLNALYENFDRHAEGRFARDVGMRNGLADMRRQPEIDRAVRLCPDLLTCEAYVATRDVCSAILGRPARYVFDHAILKMPGSDTPTAWHQDQGYMGDGIVIDSLNCWLPLQPVSAANGTLCYVPGSHLRGYQRHFRSDALNPHVMTTVVDESEAICVEAGPGDLSLHHPLTLHGAGANVSDRERLAWSVHFSGFGRFDYLRPRNILPTLKRRFVGLEG